MANGALQTIRNGMLAIGVCASLAAGSLSFAGTAEARVPAGDRVGTTAIWCGAIQDDWDKAKQERDNATTAEERDAASAKMRAAVNAWYGANCDEHYGRLAKLELPANPTKNVGHVGTVGEVSPQINPNIQPVQQIQNVQQAGAGFHSFN